VILALFRGSPEDLKALFGRSEVGGLLALGRPEAARSLEAHAIPQVG
jgi:hypothetical protein